MGRGQREVNVVLGKFPLTFKVPGWITIYIYKTTKRFVTY